MSVDDAVLLAMQAPRGLPRSSAFDVVTDPLLPSNKTSDMLAHFFEEAYDLTPESHLSRLLKVLLGDAGAGQLRKKFTYAHLSQVLYTTHFNDLDQLYGAIFGLKRFVRERITIDPFNGGTATDAEWEAVLAADASYRARIESFSRALTMTGTPEGAVMAANAVLGTECRVYENYGYVDDEDIYEPPPEGNPAALTYGDLDEFTYGEIDHRSYGSLEGQTIFRPRAQDSRSEFIIRPMRTISAEEKYRLHKVMQRITPAESLMTIDDRPARVHAPLRVRRAAASSTYWHVQSRVQAQEDHADLYDRYTRGVPVEQPRPVFSAYQGEAWSYNGDVIAMDALVADEDDNVIQGVNFGRDITGAGPLDYVASNALMEQSEVLMGRSVSDGILVAGVADRQEGDVS